MTDDLNEISRKIDRLGMLLETHSERFDEHAAEHKEWARKIDSHIHGSPSSPGMVVRLDRLEQNGERTRWAIRATVGTLISSIVASLFAWLRH